MSEARPTANWAWLVAGGMFDLNTPINSALGYVGLLQRAGPLTDQQRTYLQQAQRSILQISQVVQALAGLASLEGAWDTLERKQTVSLEQLLSEVADHPFLQNAGHVDVRADDQHEEVICLPRLLCHALAGLARSVAFDQLNGERPLSMWVVGPLAASERWIVLAAAEQIQEAVKTPRERLTPLDECAGRLSMDLPFAGSIVRAHGGQLLALPDGTSGAVVALPRATWASD